MKKIFSFILSRKLIALGIFIVLGAGIFFGVKAIKNGEGQTNYTLAQVEKGTLIVSVEGSGQVVVLDEADIKPKVSGEVTAVYAVKDQQVAKGQILFTLDATDAQKAISTAQKALTSAQNDLQEAKDDLAEAEADAEDSLSSSYEDGYSTVSTSFFKLADYMADLKDVLGTDTYPLDYIDGYKLILGTDSALIQNLLDDYDAADALYDANFTFFKATAKTASRETVYQLIEDTLETTEAISQALESARHMFDAIAFEGYSHLEGIASRINTMQPKIESDISAVYSTINSFQQIKKSIDDTNKSAPKTIKNAQLAVESCQETVVDKEEDLADAEENLANYSVRAPFGGAVTSVSAEKGDEVSGATALADLVTNQKVAEVTLNEVDIVNVKIGQKATVTFDALDDLSVTGKVSDIDALSTASQGVVNYNIVIAFDAQEEQVKPGMNLSAVIITDAKQNVLLVSNSAVKKQNGSSYVQIASSTADSSSATASLAAILTSADSLSNRTIQIGSSNDTMTEVISGLQEGDLVVVKTTTASSSGDKTQNTSSGMNGMGGVMQIMR